MIIIAKKFVLLGVLDKAFSLAPRSSANAVLQQVFAETQDHLLRVTGSDGEMSIITVTEQVDIPEPGSCLFSTQVHDIIKSCADADVTIRASESQLIIDCEDTHWEIRREILEYPRIDEEHVNIVQIPKEELSNALSRCRPAITSESIRTNFAYVQIARGRMRATDGSKFHQVVFPYAIDGLVPARAVTDIIRRIRSMALEQVEIGQNERAYTVKIDADLLIIAKHNVEYPDVDAHMLQPAQRNEQRLSLERKRFTEAVKRVALTADPDTSFMTIELSPGRLVLTTLDKYGSNARESLDVYWTDENRRLGINHNYLMDVLSAIESPDVTIMLSADSAPRLSSLYFTDDRFSAVLVQLRPDLGEAAKGSERVRAAQQGPTGWNNRGESPARSRRQLDTNPESLGQLIEDELPTERA